MGRVTRPDGSTQLTYGGHPLYTYVRDVKPGMVTGQAIDQDGGPWYVLGPGGHADPHAVHRQRVGKRIRLTMKSPKPYAMLTPAGEGWPLKNGELEVTVGSSAPSSRTTMANPFLTEATTHDLVGLGAPVGAGRLHAVGGPVGRLVADPRIGQLVGRLGVGELAGGHVLHRRLRRGPFCGPADDLEGGCAAVDVVIGQVDAPRVGLDLRLRRVAHGEPLRVLVEGAGGLEDRPRPAADPDGRSAVPDT